MHNSVVCGACHIVLMLRLHGLAWHMLSPGSQLWATNDSCMIMTDCKQFHVKRVSQVKNVKKLQNIVSGMVFIKKNRLGKVLLPDFKTSGLN